MTLSQLIVVIIMLFVFLFLLRIALAVLLMLVAGAVALVQALRKPKPPRWVNDANERAKEWLE